MKIRVTLQLQPPTKNADTWYVEWWKQDLLWCYLYRKDSTFARKLWDRIYPYNYWR